TLLMCVMVVGLNLLMIPVWGIEGAALSSLLAMFFYNLIKYLYVKKRPGFDRLSREIAKIILLELLGYAVDYFLIPTFAPVLLDIFLRSGLIVLLYGLGIWVMKIAPDSQKMVWGKMKG